jgi:ribosomal protein S3AE
MDSAKQQSEIAKLMQQITRENEAAQQGLAGLARVASHESINARMQRSAERILDLIQAGKHEEAEALLYSEKWCAEEI